MRSKTGRKWCVAALIALIGLLYPVLPVLAIDPPAAPSNLSATTADTSVILNWDDNSSDEAKFIVHRKLSSDANWQAWQDIPENVTTWTDTGLTRGEIYLYRVFAVNAAGLSLSSNAISYTVPLSPIPAAPSNLTATAADTSVVLNWNDNSSDETKFTVDRKLSSEATWYPYQDIAANVSTFTDTGLTRGETYQYRVFAINASGSSASSNAISYTVPLSTGPAAPSNLTATAADTSVVLNWNDNSSNETRFTIDRKRNSDVIWHNWQDIPENVTTWTDIGLTRGEIYLYRVFAVNAAGLSASSNVVSYTVPTSTLPPTSIPGAPTVLTVSGSGTTATLAWNDNSDSEDGFYIDRMVGDGPWQLLTTTLANVRSFTDSGLPQGMMVSYRVQAYNTAGSSAESNTAAYPVPEGHPSGATTVMKFCINSNYYYINGVRADMDVAPVIMESRTLLPIGYLAIPLGAATNWNPINQTVTVSLGSNTVEMKIGDPYALVNGSSVAIDPANLSVKPVILPPGRTMLPMSFIARTLGCSVSWDAVSQEVVVTYPGV